jgi:hypothetical protein
MTVTSHLRHGFKSLPVKKSLPLPLDLGPYFGSLVDADIVGKRRVLDGLAPAQCPTPPVV